MQFIIPTTKNEMYEVLQEIFYYYRIRRESWGGVDLKELKLPRLTFEGLTDLELRQKAVTLVTPGVERERETAQYKLEESISALGRENALLPL